MNREFTYNWKILLQALLAIPIIGGYVVWKQTDFNLTDYIVMAVIIMFITGRNLLPLSWIRLTDDTIYISPLIYISSHPPSYYVKNRKSKHRWEGSLNMGGRGDRKFLNICGRVNRRL